QAERSAAAQERQYLAQALQHYQVPLVAEFRQKFEDVVTGKITPVQLAQSDPVRFSEFQAYQTQFGQIQNAQAQLAHKAAEDAQAALVDLRTVENAKIVEALPELQDEGKRKAFDSDISQFLTGLGY